VVGGVFIPGFTPAPLPGMVFTPDGAYVYAANYLFNNVAVVDTTSATVTTTVPIGSPVGLAITPDGKRVYVANSGDVSVIDTPTNTVVATIPVGMGPSAVGIIPDIPFSAFSAKLAIQAAPSPNAGAFELLSEFTLGSASNGINPPAEPVTLQVGTFAMTIPPGSFKGKGYGPFTFDGTINGVALEVAIVPTGAKRYAFGAAAQNVNLTGTANPVTVRASIGVDSATTSVNAKIFGSEISRAD
jgi:YVTN family beta-propeller protein